VEVILIRHAAAVDETLAVRDPHRHLTALGRTEARSLGERLRWHDCGPTHVWASPLVRAMQTAELVVAGLQTEVAVESDPRLAPGEHPRELIAALLALPATSVVMLVGHEPGLSAIGAALVGEAELPVLAKAEAARIVDGKLRWRFAWNAEAPAIATS
jgi:phosphohistidine phosphatase